MSPTKLRMKLMGSPGGGKKVEASGKSSRASPSRLDEEMDDDDHPKNSLLPQELDEEYPKDRSDSSRSRSDTSHGRAHSGGESGHETGNGCGGNFEFQREVRGPFFRAVPSKWNDAEKWIAGRHVVHSNPIFSKKPAAAVAAGGGGGGGGRVAPDSAAASSTSRGRGGGGAGSGSSSAVTEQHLPPSSKSSSPPSVSRPPPQKRLRAAAATVSMRDVGTEMTPIASQEQSRSGTPAGAATPSPMSPLCSVPCSPRLVGSSRSSSFSAASEREHELRLRTRREIAALGLQLGKMNIASWASKEEGILAAGAAAAAADVTGAVDDEVKTKEFEARAAAWEESRKCKLAVRYQKKEMKIQEWESFQKSKFETKLKQAEVKAEQMKAHAKQDMAKRMSVLSHKVEGKQARVEAKRSRQATRLARQVERMRKTGRAPSRFRRCCTWFF
ncbi:hypothetical protein QOZ80_5BG0446510 [Eleusine coracana subsp. coracana]|nr:hypothetical protein QOZ80_5BG0446510 [Eleusine coracana subsp. coracana]